MIYEYRVYEALPGKMGTLVEIMKVAVPVFKRLGMNPTPIWKPSVGANNNSIVYMLAFKDMEDRNRKWDAFRDDAEWKEKRAKFGPDPVTETQFNSFLKPTDHSPAK